MCATILTEVLWSAISCNIKFRRQDICPINVEFAPSYEEQGPFGAKSIGEVVIDTPCPAIANALENACGVRIREMPITAEKVWRALNER